MECDICARDASSGQDFLCVTCARSATYLMRLETARVLIQKEALSRQIESIVQPSATGEPAKKSVIAAQTAWKEECQNVAKADMRVQIDETNTRISAMREEMELMRQEISQRQARIAARQKVLDTINSALPDRRDAAVSTSREVIEKGTNSVNNLNTRLTSTRAFLCRETATLLRLKPRRRLKDGVMQAQYSITGMLLPDFREINNMRCSDLSAVLTSVAHLVVLVSFYLGIRLPAEITVPHRDYPLPTINTPANSYLRIKAPFPAPGAMTTASGSPFSSKHDLRTVHRPRPLFIGSDDVNEKLAQYAKRDASAFNFFAEGISLLAWDIAWLNRTQGFVTGTLTWEDMCNVGRNLHQLLFTPLQSPALNRILSDRDARRRSLRAQDQQHPSSDKSGTSTPVPASSGTGSATPVSPSNHALLQSTPGRLGSTSHHTTHPTTNLSTPPQNEINKSTMWRFSNYQPLSDALRRHLLNEMNNAEWEVLQEQEWDDGGEAFDQTETVFVKGRYEQQTLLPDQNPVPSSSTASPTTPKTSAQTSLPSSPKLESTIPRSFSSDRAIATRARMQGEHSHPSDETDSTTTTTENTVRKIKALNETDLDATNSETNTSAKRGTSGWTKIRGR